MSASPSVHGTDTPTAVSDTHENELNEKKIQRAHGKIELTDDDCADKLGFAFSSRKKWTILRYVPCFPLFSPANPAAA